MSALPTIPRAIQRELRERAEKLCELARQRKLLEDEERALKASTLEDMDTWGLGSWGDDFFKLDVRERMGAETADIPALKAAGLVQYLKTGKPSRFVIADRK